MSTEYNLFNWEEALNLQDKGMAIAANTKRDLLEIARLIAIELGSSQEFVTMDDVHLAMLRKGLEPTKLGNASGSVFRHHKTWICTGMVRKSSRIKTHAHIQRIWKLA